MSSSTQRNSDQYSQQPQPEATFGARDAAVPVKVGTWNIANVLTMLRIAIVPFFGWALLYADGTSTTARLIALALFAVASITDRLDGDIARKRGLETEFGKLMDPIADKALMGMAFVGLSIIGILPWWITIIVLVRELAVTLLRFVVIRRGVIAASRGGKIKTTLQILAAGLFIAPLPHWGHLIAWVVMAAAVAVTIWTGLEYFVSALRPARQASLSERS